MRVELAGQKIDFPSQCTCCGESPNADNYIASSTKDSITREWQFPMCDQCHAHRAICQNGANTAGLLFGISVVGALGISQWVFVVGLILAFAAARRAQSKTKAAQRPTCATTGGAPATFVKWQGTLQVFDIQSSAYATAFLRENASKAVNLTTQARTALAGTGANLTRQSVR